MSLIFSGLLEQNHRNKRSPDKCGWLRNGNLFYRDDNYNFYFVNRLKLLLKYRNHQISPTEIENVIYGYPGVLDVAVSAREIKDLVEANLTDTKQLRGGVIFLQDFPITPTCKIKQSLLKQIVAEYL
ncbi:unnamed protein product [Pieris macdunnoughi]|uniref:Uncharacterized protein n=1 Tax=Pieris macdunnoughi TaxID=345717 RepID=A0A821PF32_9NEOP|nr:unnamed protein product [Pieris macdunnoughi]